LVKGLTDYPQPKRTLEVGQHYVRQSGPLRDGAALDSAIGELVERDRLRIMKDGKRISIRLNPALIGVTQ